MRPGTCKHYNGDHHNKTCAAGVCYRDVTTDPDNIKGRAFRKPCHSQMHWDNPSPSQLAEFGRRGTCDKYQEPTKEEITAHDAEMAAAVKRMQLLSPLIAQLKKQHTQSGRATIECPACKGRLHIQINCFTGIHGPEKHSHGQCETEGCFAWRE